MNYCPQCSAETEDGFELCWNCNYSFAAATVLQNEDFSTICPKCQTEVNAGDKACPNCNTDLESISKKRIKNNTEIRNINCLRCAIPMAFGGNYKFHEGARMGVLGDFFELFVNKESFDLYTCPKCGKVEFFIPITK